jgi:hypothetical protein
MPGWRSASTPLIAEIANQITAEGHYRIHLRLREAHALELQQRLLAEMGRIGLIAQMPGTFPVRVVAYSHGPAALRQLALPVTAREGGVCYVGRDKDGNEQTKLVMTEGAIDELLTAVGSIGGAEVHERARDALARLQKAKSFGFMLQQGMLLPKNEQTSVTEIKATLPEENGQPAKEGVICLVARNPNVVKPIAKNGALMLVISDLEVGRPQPATEDTVASSADTGQATDPAT